MTSKQAQDKVKREQFKAEFQAKTSSLRILLGIKGEMTLAWQLCVILGSFLTGLAFSADHIIGTLLYCGAAATFFILAWAESKRTKPGVMEEKSYSSH